MTLIKHWSFVIVFALISSNLFAQESSLAKSNYVVIGVFQQMNNAVRYTDEAGRTGFLAQYAVNKENSLYYVFLMSDADKMKAYLFLSKIRKETIYKDAWIFIGTLGTEGPTVTQTQQATDKKEIKVAPVIEEPVLPKEEVKSEPKVELKPEPNDTIKELVSVVPSDSTHTIVAVDSSALKKGSPEAVKKVRGKPFYFKTVTNDGRELVGNVQLQEAVGATKYQLIKTGEITYITSPINKGGKYEITVQIPGYKQSTLTFNYVDPQREHGAKDEDVITIMLEKAGKGDYIDFSNVHFFKNTSIFQPQAQNELDALVRIMNDNPNYKIKIYGYVNGKNSRETITIGTSTNFFAIDKLNKRSRLSSKDLSVARAETAKAYLVTRGIEANRISIKGEGGAVPLYAEDGSQAQLNDRIEVEFVKNN